MDVRCSRCGTEYEFDDALISERGTTVKCTNCGFQFKIFPAKGVDSAPERWVVRTGSDRELVYTSLRELQRGIADKKVGPQDLLSRGKQPPRPLASIAELEPFFQASSSELERVPRTLHGVAPPASSLSALAREAHPSPPGVTGIPGEPEPEPARPGLDVARSAVEGQLSTTRQAQLDALAETLPTDFLRPAAVTLPQGSIDAATLTAAPPDELSSPRQMAATTLVARQERVPESGADVLLSFPRATPQSFDSTPRAPVSSPRNIPPLSVEHIRDSFASYDELDVLSEPGGDPARRARSRWIAGVVVIGVLALLGATIGRRYLSQLAGGSETRASSDARVTKFLTDGNALLEESDFEGAKEELDKASALAERDPAVLTALAQLETRRADLSWLKLRLLDPNNTELVRATYRELGRRVGKARSAVDRAFAISPEDPVVLRARVDALRLSGDADKAREWIAPLSSNASVPENAYVLAALDLADPSPVWPTVIDRLRTAASAERDPGRARAALIYALVRAGRLSEAQAEFNKLDGRTKPHPLLEELRAFLLRAGADTDAGSPSSKLTTVDTTRLPKLDTSPSTNEEEAHHARAAMPTETAPSGDFRARLTQAATALQSGDLTRAEQLYNSVLSEQPNNTEALSGLGDVAKRRHDPATASQMYARVLAMNPGYLPAILASADQKWDSGDKQGALVLYHRLLDQGGASSQYGTHAAARIAQAESSPAVTTPSSSAEEPPQPPTEAKPEPTTAPPSSPPPGIDTTDLPGAQ